MSVDRSQWPEDLRGASGRDALLVTICRAWRLFFGGGDDPPIETIKDNDAGLHCLRRGSWEVWLVDTDAFDVHMSYSQKPPRGRARIIFFDENGNEEPA